MEQNGVNIHTLADVLLLTVIGWFCNFLGEHGEHKNVNELTLTKSLVIKPILGEHGSLEDGGGATRQG